ncbi:MAG TPA: nucleotidyltransferase domain-containing protein [Spirochaetota bacterium]|nr:nucleotidyltransferase domain-containing protein [Spirochaetota bacterium]
MRLNDKEINSIRNAFAVTFESGEIYLFGSRTDDSQKGGDIDLFVVPRSDKNISEKKIDFLVRLKRAIGEQKIDVVIDRGQNRLVDRKVRETGVLLCRK